jgi:hypothetical protein
MRIAIIAMLALVCAASSAEARQRHVAHQKYDPACNVTMPCEGVGKPDIFAKSAKNSARESRRLARGQALYDAMPFGMPTSSASEGRSFIRGHLKCAVNVGAELARRGIRGTGSALAKSYLHWGRASGPVAGAVAVFNRGRRGKGHVAIVHHVEPNGTVIYLNPSSRRQAWQIGPYRKRPIAFRVAGF